MAKVKAVELNDKQKKFCLEYIKDFNITQAAIRAGYSEQTASEQGSRLLSDVRVQAVIKNKLIKVENKYDISRERIAERYGQLVNFDIRKLYDEDGNLIPVHKLDADTATALTGIEVEETEDFLGRRTTSKKLKTSGIIDALNAASKFNGYNMPDKIEQSGKIETSVIIKRG